MVLFMACSSRAVRVEGGPSARTVGAHHPGARPARVIRAGRPYGLSARTAHMDHPRGLYVQLLRAGRPRGPSKWTAHADRSCRLPARTVHANRPCEPSLRPGRSLLASSPDFRICRICRRAEPAMCLTNCSNNHRFAGPRRLQKQPSRSGGGTSGSSLTWRQKFIMEATLGTVGM